MKSIVRNFPQGTDQIEKDILNNSLGDSFSVLRNLIQRTSRFVCLMLAFVFSVIPRGVYSANENALSLDEMVGLADEIVVGRVLSSEARWQGKLIVTISTVEISESLKGLQKSEIEITQLGGTAVHPVIGAAVTMTASEEAVLRAGEQVVLFASQPKPGTFLLVGGAQGKFIVRDETATGVQNLPVGPKKLTVRRGTEGNVISSEVMTLDGLRDRVAEALTRQRTAPPGGKSP